MMTKRKDLSLRSRRINISKSNPNNEEELANNNDATLKNKTTEKTLASKKAQDSLKVVRDTYTMPLDDHKIIASLKNECMRLGIEMNKSEIVRAGLHTLTNMSPSDLMKAAFTVQKIKTGRPTKQNYSKNTHEE